ncbi:hypothetical protein SJ05684_b52860 (plasmid) [Sinorhizobium sojae CCBAU 05684]|uniref:Uncharacterized protein n=1 Tax=Sinorhizobium sojae CCBAU 05684 TaxID=716928 RepID=A0A249PK18_9HYPH|nr:hypothetical protein SJ05684_b52860 [Sinorhizobium sojae CCBAU 05684]
MIVDGHRPFPDRCHVIQIYEISAHAPDPLPRHIGPAIWCDPKGRYEEFLDVGIPCRLRNNHPITPPKTTPSIADFTTCGSVRLDPMRGKILQI